VLLLLDFWPLRRTRWSPAVGGPVRAVAPGRLLLEKLPFLILAVAASVVTVRVQRTAGAIADASALPFAARLPGALAAYGWYAVKNIWPSGLAVLYPNPALAGGGVASWQAVAAAVALAVVGVLALREAGRRPWLLVGGATFVGMLVPVVGFVQVGQQWTADRYTYLPSVGLLVMLVGALCEALRRLRVPRVLSLAALAAVLLLLGAATRLQLTYWRDSVALASRALAVTDGNYVMHFNLALALDEQGELRGALRHYGEAVRLRPDLASFRVNYGAALTRAGRVDDAVAQYRRAMELDPRDPAAFNNLAWLRATHPAEAYRNGAEAMALAGEVVRRRPGDPDALDLLAAALAEQGRFADAERTAAAALAAATASGRSDLSGPIAERRALYGARRAYRETPGVASAPAQGGAADVTARSPEPSAGAPPRPSPPPATVP